jgi:HSF-type DNA-binding
MAEVRIAAESPDKDDSSDKKRSAESHAYLDTYDEDDPHEKSQCTFPEKLMELLEEETSRDSMWWLSGGDAFTIVPKNFAEKVLDKHFQGTKFESFTRKLNRW